MRKPSRIDRDLAKWVNSLSSEQVAKLHGVIDGPVPAEIAAMSDGELLAELHPMSIGETAANGVNHTPSGTESGEENISEVMANAKSSDTREGFAARTPSRWRWEYDDNGFYCVTAYAAPSPYIVATGGEGETDKDNAAFIVRAVNSHDDLLAALNEVADFLDNQSDVEDGDYGIPRPNRAMRLLIEVRNAITKATGVTP